jgi:hypothetical protein
MIKRLLAGLFEERRDVTFDTTAAQFGLNKCRRATCQSDAICGSCGCCEFHCTCNGRSNHGTHYRQ